jgi:pimeloyl-ACP methyl ester carboxylesterase
VSAPSPDQPTIRFVDVDGIRLRTSVRGCGPPLLLVTGLGASLDMARPFEQELTARGVQTVAFDAPGIGESTAYTLPRRMPGIARTIEAMLGVLGYDRVDVLGVSLGGVVAQQLAHQAPRRVRRLVLAATGPGLGSAPGSPRVLLALATPHRYYQPDYYRSIAGRIYGGQARRDPDALLHGSPARFVERPSVRGTALGSRVPRPAVRHRRLDQPALAAQAPATDARAGRRRRPDRPATQRTHPRPPHSRRPPARRGRRWTPVSP